MTARIEKRSSGRRKTIRLIGRIQSEHLDELKVQIADIGPQVTLDLAEVFLVDVEVVHFLIACEVGGVDIANCPPYVREWMVQERSHHE